MGYFFEPFRSRGGTIASKSDENDSWHFLTIFEKAPNRGRGYTQSSNERCGRKSHDNCNQLRRPGVCPLKRPLRSVVCLRGLQQSVQRPVCGVLKRRGQLSSDAKEGKPFEEKNLHTSLLRDQESTIFVTSGLDGGGKERKKKTYRKPKPLGMSN